MKKTIIVLGLILALGVGSIFASADSNTIPFGRNFGRMPWNRTELTDKQIEELVKDRKEFQKENMEFRKEELKKSLDSKQITQEQYDSWLEHFNYMEEFHEENGFFGGGCGIQDGGIGRGMGMMRGSGRRAMGWN